MQNEFKMRDFARRPDSVIDQHVWEDLSRGQVNSFKAAGAAGYLAFVGALGVYAAKALGYDLGPIEKAAELLGPFGSAIVAGTLTYPITRVAQDYREDVI